MRESRFRAHIQPAWRAALRNQSEFSAVHSQPHPDASELLLSAVLEALHAQEQHWDINVACIQDSRFRAMAVTAFHGQLHQAAAKYC